MNIRTQQIQSLLFYLSQPMSIAELARMTQAKEEDILNSLTELEENLVGQGIRLLRHGGTVTLVTAPEASELLTRIAKEELEKDLSKASLETLAIILYKGPLTRSEVDYIRGVNSNFILRNLMIRGLVEKIDNPKDQRSFLYRATNTLLEHMGVARVEDLPGYAESIDTLAAFLSTEKKAEEQAAQTPTSPETHPQPEPDEASMEEQDRTEDTELANDNYEDTDFSSRTHHE